VSRPRKKAKASGPPGTPEWMVTFSDIMSLLVTFFVLLMTFSSFDSDTFDLISGGLKGSFGVVKETDRDDLTSMLHRYRTSAARRHPSGPEVPPDYESVSEIAQRLRRELKMLDVLRFVDLVHLDQGLVIRIQDDLLFGSGQAELMPDSQTVLAAIAGAVRRIRNRLMVEGHTDDSFLPTRTHPDGHALSLARAVSVSEWLIGHGVDGCRVGVAGAGRYKPLFPNSSARGRARNRRVEITIDAPPTRRTRT